MPEDEVTITNNWSPTSPITGQPAEIFAADSSVTGARLKPFSDIPPQAIVVNSGSSPTISAFITGEATMAVGSGWDSIEPANTIVNAISGLITNDRLYNDVKAYEIEFNMPSAKFVKEWEGGRISPTYQAYRFANLSRMVFRDARHADGTEKPRT